jgi:hypothetical protein
MVTPNSQAGSKLYMSVYLPKIAGVLVALDIFAVYVYSLAIKRRYPPSHPWSGISLAFLAIFLLSSYIPGNQVNVLGWLAVLVAVSATLWTVAAILAN